MSYEETVLPVDSFCLALVTQSGTPQIVVGDGDDKPRTWETRIQASEYLGKIDPNGYKQAMILQVDQAFKSGWVLS